MPDNITIVKSAYAAFHRRDVDGVLAFFAPDIEWIHPDGMNVYGLGGAKKGHDEVRAFMARVPSVFATMRPDPQEFLASGDRVVVFGEHQMQSKKGGSGVVRFVHSWHFQAGKAKRFEDYFDTVEVHRILESTRHDSFNDPLETR